MIEVLNKNDFNSKVLQSQGKVLVEFFATWCPHCRRMMPVIEDIAQREEGSVAVYQVDVDQSPDLANEYAPNGFPTFALFVDGALVGRLEGEQPEPRLLEFLQ